MFAKISVGKKKFKWNLLRLQNDSLSSVKCEFKTINSL